MNLRYQALLGLTLALGVTGCDAVADDASESADPVADAPANDLNGDLASVTAAAAAALGDPATARWVHGETMERFDGETNVLWNTLNAEPAGAQARTGARRWSSLLAQTGRFEGSEAAGLSGTDVPAEIEAVVARVAEALGGPVHLYWPNAEDWDGTTTPLVGYTPVGVDLDAVEQIDGFDVEGNRVKITEALAAARPVVVVTRNERAAADGTVPTGLTPAAVTLVENGTETSLSGSAAADPLRAGYMRLVNVKFKHDYEGWTQGAPEFRISYTRTTYQTGALATEGPIHLDSYGGQIDKCQDRGQTCTLNINLFPWQANLYRSYHFQWYEADGGSTNKVYDLSGVFKVVGSLVGLPADVTGEIGKFFKITVDKEDDMLVKNIIHTDDPEPKYYGLGEPSYTVSLTPGGPTPAGTTGLVADGGADR